MIIFRNLLEALTKIFDSYQPIWLVVNMIFYSIIFIMYSNWTQRRNKTYTKFKSLQIGNFCEFINSRASIPAV